MRQVVLDTETTGIDPQQGHRIIEIGCVELVDRKLTGNHYHVYLNPERIMDNEVIKIHGITNDFLTDKPLFHDIVTDFCDFIFGAELVIHNAAFDLNFINHEFSLLKGKLSPGKANDRTKHRQPNEFGPVEQYCQVLDTLLMARKKHPGQKNSLDALCKRYGIDNSHRELHGALLDAQLLADVYLLMSGGQTNLQLGGDSAGENSITSIQRINRSAHSLKVVRANDEESVAHEHYLASLRKGPVPVVWNS